MVICAYLQTSHQIDLLQEGRRVVLQKDIEHVLVRLDLSSIKRAISNSRKAVLEARGLILVNTLAGKSDRDGRQLLKLLEHSLQEIGIRDNLFHKIFEVNNEFSRQKDKRALEILGDLISSVTGVPSARDHRKLLEQLQLLKLNKDELEILSLIHI